MQEEVESRTVNLAISTSKLSARTIVSAVKAYLNHRKNVKVKKEHEAEIPTQGKQTVKELIGQGQGVTNIDIAKTDLRGFEKVARKYGIDYAIARDKASPISISPKRISGALKRWPGNTVSTMRSGGIPLWIRPITWSSSRQRMRMQ